MAEYKEIHTYDHDASSNSTALVVFFVAVLALVAIGFLVWAPWTASTGSTTIITQPQESRPPDNTTIINPPSNTTIVNPPAEPPKTEINIETGKGESTGTTGESGIDLPK